MVWFLIKQEIHLHGMVINHKDNFICTTLKAIQAGSCPPALHLPSLVHHLTPLPTDRLLKGLPYEPDPIGKDWTLHTSCSYLLWPGLVHHLTPFLPLISLSFPASFWPAWTLPPLIFLAWICALFPSTSHFTLKIKAALSSAVSTQNITT
jgi:hypothetical protein